MKNLKMLIAINCIPFFFQNISLACARSYSKNIYEKYDTICARSYSKNIYEKYDTITFKIHFFLMHKFHVFNRIKF